MLKMYQNAKFYGVLMFKNKVLLFVVTCIFAAELCAVSKQALVDGSYYSLIAQFEARGVTHNNNEELESVKKFCEKHMKRAWYADLDQYLDDCLKGSEKNKNKIVLCRLAQSKEICGILFCDVRHIKYDATVDLYNVMIDSKYSNQKVVKQNIMSLMISSAEKMFAQQAVKKLAIFVGGKDTEGRKLYSQCGFSQPTSDKISRLFTFDGADVILMQKKI